MPQIPRRNQTLSPETLASSGTFPNRLEKYTYTLEELVAVCTNDLPIMMLHDPLQETDRTVRDVRIDNVAIIAKNLLLLPPEERLPESDLGRARQGSLTWLFNAVRPQIKGSHRSLPKNQRLSAQDFEQELMLRMIEKIIPAYKPEIASFTTFLNAVSRNILIDNCGTIGSEFKKAKRLAVTAEEKGGNEAMSLWHLPPDVFISRLAGEGDDRTANDPASIVSRREILRIVLDGVASVLSDVERDAYTAVILGEVTRKKYSTEHQIPLPTIKTRVARASRKIQEILAANGINPVTGESLL